jgi:dolichol-phosphate mannosyltransferase
MSMISWARPVRWGPFTVLRVAAGLVAVSRLLRAARRVAPVEPMIAAAAAAAAAGGRISPETVASDTVASDTVASGTIAVVIPARDEAARIGPVLAAVVGAPGVSRVIVVDDASTDATAEVARAAGAEVIHGLTLPPGWAGKAWALQQGIERAGTDWVVTLDADTRPDPDLPAALVARAVSERCEFLTVGGRFDCPTAGAQWLHPAMLTTLVYRFGPSGSAAIPPPHRTMANGQCMTLCRVPFLAAGGLSLVAGQPVEDVALARALATAGWSVRFLDASEMLTVRMYETLAETWQGWGRSLALPGVEPRRRQLIDLAVVLAAQSLALPRVLSRRGDAVDLALLALRLGTLAGTAPAYERRTAAYWLSPLADLPATLALALGIFRPRQTWRGRVYETPSTRPGQSADR